MGNELYIYNGLVELLFEGQNKALVYEFRIRIEWIHTQVTLVAAHNESRHLVDQAECHVALVELLLWEGGVPDCFYLE